nr:MAG TPA: hypothetical protein [Caudoviricetes sp.]
MRKAIDFVELLRLRKPGGILARVYKNVRRRIVAAQPGTATPKARREEKPNATARSLTASRNACHRPDPLAGGGLLLFFLFFAFTTSQSPL